LAMLRGSHQLDTRSSDKHFNQETFMTGKDLFALSTLTLLAALAFGATPADAHITNRSFI
jgi:hypothetical protein